MPQQLLQVIHQDSVGLAVVIFLVHNAGCARCIGLVDVVPLELALLELALLKMALLVMALLEMGLLGGALQQRIRRLRGLSLLPYELLWLWLLPGSVSAGRLSKLHDNS